MLRIVATALILSPIALAAHAQRRDTTQKATPLAAVSITATRTVRSTFDTPQPTTVFDAATIGERLPNGVADLFRDIAGFDVSGVGPNQRRPEIRLQRGQRILLLDDGLRLNNARRQQDFGEIPALAGLSSVERVEVVRGPSSVLYGTDAIGGVVNLISRAAPRAYRDGEVHGGISYRYGSAGTNSMPQGSLAFRAGPIGVWGNAAYRDAEAYRAPKGTFGNITLANDTEVLDSGVRDRSYELGAAYFVSPASELFTRAKVYRADRAGFGFLDPALLGPNEARVQLYYPDQDYRRYTAGYRASALSTPVAHRAELTLYRQTNERHFNSFVLAPIAPGATVDSKSFNFTDLATVGGRLELARSIGRHVLTYGADAFRDKSENTDSSRTVITGLGPPITRVSTVPSVPNATFRSAGLFGQLELNPTTRLTTVLGARVQDIVAETHVTPGTARPPVKASDRTAVWTGNALYRLTSGVNVVASVGRGFRAPNLVERFFEGAVTEGNGFQRANPSLVAETSLNTDLGLRYRRGSLYGESFVFRNIIHDAIKAVATGQTVNGRPEFRNENVGRLRVDGLESMLGARFLQGFDANASYTRLIGHNVTDPDSPIGDSYATKVVGDIGYHEPAGRFSVGYTVRHQGVQKDVIIGTNPIGYVIPAFTVHSARGSVRLYDRAGLSNRLVFTVDNLFDKLYGESPNASFFRPEPGRSLTLAIATSF